MLSSTDAHGSVTRFWYDAQGNSKIIQDAAGNYTTANYNQLGQRTQLFDPNMGDWSFSYNGLGEVIRQTDARSQSIDFFYDVLGRLYRRTVLNTASVELGAFVDEWEYDVAGAGLLHNETRIVGVGNGQSATVFDRTYNYDAYYRPAGYSVELDPYQYPDTTQAADIPVLPLTARYEVGMEYDGYFARVKSVTYPQERFRLYQRYDQNGYLWQEGDSRNQSQALKSVTAMNPANQVTAETFGNGSTQTYVHHQRTFQMQNTKVNGGNLLTQSYNYDHYGNLTELKHQQGNNALRTETFGYDHLHRLTQSQRSGVAPISYSYDAIGNLTEKDDFADSYSYGSGRPNAVSSVTLSGGGTANYGYDANGNMTTAQGNGNSQAAQDVGQLALKYDPYNKPFFIERNGKRSEFWYGPDDQRYFQLENGNQRTVYIDKLYEQIGSTVHKLYLGDYAVFTVDVTSAANSGINYLHKDRLGSIVSITDESGSLIANAGRSFDPFGKPREEDLADSDGLTHASMPDDIGDLNRPDITTRGFTGHEQLNNLSLTHMNGRVYDYNLGRFLSVDPVIQFPENSQSLNPYSYIMNNPLSATDPTGYYVVWDRGACMGSDGATASKCNQEATMVLQKLGVEVDNGVIKLPTGGIINNESAIDSILAADSDIFEEECIGCVEKGSIIGFALDSSLKRAGVDPYDLQYALACVGERCRFQSDNLNLNREEYLQAVRDGLWKSVVPENGISSNEEVRSVASSVNAKKAASGGDVSSEQSYIDFLKATSRATTKAKLNLPDGSQRGEKFLVLGTNSNDEVVVIRVGVLTGQGGSISVAGAGAVAHVHYRGLIQRPDGADHSAVKFKGIPSFVIGQTGRRIWEVGRQNNIYVYRSVHGSEPGSWKEFKGAK